MPRHPRPGSASTPAAPVHPPGLARYGTDFAGYPGEESAPTDDPLPTPSRRPAAATTREAQAYLHDSVERLAQRFGAPERLPAVGGLLEAVLEEYGRPAPAGTEPGDRRLQREVFRSFVDRSELPPAQQAVAVDALRRVYNAAVRLGEPPDAAPAEPAAGAAGTPARPGLAERPPGLREALADPELRDPAQAWVATLDKHGDWQVLPVRRVTLQDVAEHALQTMDQGRTPAERAGLALGAFLTNSARRWRGRPHENSVSPREAAELEIFQSLQRPVTALPAEPAEGTRPGHAPGSPRAVRSVGRTPATSGPEVASAPASALGAPAARANPPPGTSRPARTRPGRAGSGPRSDDPGPTREPAGAGDPAIISVPGGSARPPAGRTDRTSSRPAADGPPVHQAPRVRPRRLATLAGLPTRAVPGRGHRTAGGGGRDPGAP